MEGPPTYDATFGKSPTLGRAYHSPTIKSRKITDKKYSCCPNLKFAVVLGRVGAVEILFYAFDLLWIDGEDMRGLLLIERKAQTAPSANVDRV